MLTTCTHRYGTPPPSRSIWPADYPARRARRDGRPRAPLPGPAPCRPILAARSRLFSPLGARGARDSRRRRRDSPPPRARRWRRARPVRRHRRAGARTALAALIGAAWRRPRDGRRPARRLHPLRHRCGTRQPRRAPGGKPWSSCRLLPPRGSLPSLPPSSIAASPPPTPCSPRRRTAPRCSGAWPGAPSRCRSGSASTPRELPPTATSPAHRFRATHGLDGRPLVLFVGRKEPPQALRPRRRGGRAARAIRDVVLVHDRRATSTGFRSPRRACASSAARRTRRAARRLRRLRRLRAARRSTRASASSSSRPGCARKPVIGNRACRPGRRRSSTTASTASSAATPADFAARIRHLLDDPAARPPRRRAGQAKAAGALHLGSPSAAASTTLCRGAHRRAGTLRPMTDCIVLDGLPLQVRSAGIAVYTGALVRACSRRPPADDLRALRRRRSGSAGAALAVPRTRRRQRRRPTAPNVVWYRSPAYPW